jgi:hypothetical protein
VESLARPGGAGKSASAEGPRAPKDPRAERPPSERDIARWLGVIVGDGQAVEIRAPKTVRASGKASENVVRRFPAGDLAEAAREALRLSERAPAVYVVMNGVKAALLSQPRGPKGARAADVPGRRWLLIDFDPDRPADVSATRAEKGRALKLMMAVRGHLEGRGWPAPVEADSGNGFHLLYRIDLPNDDPSAQLVKAVLAALADRFDADGCKVDRKVFDAPRLVKLYGTAARKGTPTDERPHRFAKVLKTPGTLKVVSAELLRALAGEGRPVGQDAPKAPDTTPAPRRSAAQTHGRADVEARAVKYINACGPSVEGQDGSGQLLKVAIKIGCGLDLPRETVIRLLSEHYNVEGRCDPPWPQKLLDRKVDEAYRVETRRGWLLTEDRRNGGNGAHRNGSGNGNGLPAPPGPVPPAEVLGDDGDRRPVIVITTEEHAVIDSAISALAAEPNVFQRANALVTVLRDASRLNREKIHRPKGSPRITPLQHPRLRELMTKTAAWKKVRTDRNGDVENVSAHPPDWATNGVAARGEWPEIRPIEAIIEAPALRHDGTILDTPGWDEATELLYEPNAGFPKIPGRPDREDARYAAERLMELVVDFPFAGENHRAAWLAALLTPLARFAIDGPCPLFLFDANTPGSGKSKLTDIISMISTGRDMPRTAYPDSDEEMRKRITATALAGDRLMLIDNIATTFGGSSLDSALTASSWQDRKLGASEMTPPLPLFVVWYATGNNVGLRGDVLRRVVPCRLEAKDEHPEERTDFTIKGDLLHHVRRLRPELVAAALTLLRAHALAGRPDSGLAPLGSFEAWSDVVRSCVHWATGLDPCATRAELRANDPDTIARAALLEGWSELPGADHGLTVAEALRLLKADTDGRFNKLKDCLMEWSRNDDLPSAKAIGQRLKLIRARVCNRRSIQSTEYQGTQVWKVVSG